MMNHIIKTAAAIAIMMMTTAVALAADIVVLQSNTPNYLPGKILSSGTIIELADGDELLLASESGALTLSGPYSGPPEEAAAADEQSVLKALDELLGKSPADTGDLGVIRGTSNDGSDDSCGDAPPGIWSLAVVSGERCVPADDRVTFWREDATQDSTLLVKRIATDEEAELEWASGNNSLTWPESLQQANGETFSVRYAADIRSKNVTLIKMPDGIDSDVQIITWLATQGCTCQAEKIYDGLQR